MEKEQICAYALSRIFRFEPRIACALVRQMGSAAEIFSLDRGSLAQVLGLKYRDAIADASLDKYASELERILSGGRYRYLCCSDPDFPVLLSECEDAPTGFFVRSEDSFANIFGRECFSVVGTRDMSSYGRQWCDMLVRTLAGTIQRPTIVSGLAFGVDVTAHLSALDASLPTIAVLGTGVNVIYPKDHERIAERIMSTPCSAVISEYPPDEDVLATNFLSRNRIIAGLSRATLLVESRLKGGGMSTARSAASYNRDVFALPGRNDDVRSQGCNLLIQSQIAQAVTSCESLVSALGYKMDRKASASATAAVRVSDFYAGSSDAQKTGMMSRIIREIRSCRDISLEDLASRTGYNIKDVTSLCRRLENDGFISIDLLQQCSIS